MAANNSSDISPEDSSNHTSNKKRKSAGKSSSADKKERHVAFRRMSRLRVLLRRSLLLLLDQLEAEDVRNVTRADLDLKSHCSRKATVSFGRAATLRELCDAYLLPLAHFLADACNSQQHLPTRPDLRAAALIKPEEIMTMFGMMLFCIAHRPATLTEYLRAPNRSGLSANRWEKITSLLMFNIDSLIRCCNATFKLCLTAAGWVSFDETIWASDGGWLGVRDHPEKPITRGVKVFHLGFRLPLTGRSYCWHFFPDRYSDCLKPAETLDCAVAALDNPSHHIITADRWFGSVAWLQSKPTVNAVMAVKFGSESQAFTFMTRDLYKGEYRVYEWKNLLVSIHNNIDLNIVISSAHAPLDQAPPHQPPNAAQQVGLLSRLCPTATADLAKLKNDTLQQLARALGESESGSKAELIGRIGRQPLPLPDKSDVGMVFASVSAL
jgi:hypothetical protein